MTPFIYKAEMTMNHYKRSIGMAREDRRVKCYNPHVNELHTYLNGAVLLLNIQLKRRPSATSSV